MLIVKRPPFVRPENVVGTANKTATTGISVLVIVDTIASPAVKDVRTQNVPTYRFFFKLAKQKGNDLLMQKGKKNVCNEHYVEGFPFHLIVKFDSFSIH